MKDLNELLQAILDMDAAQRRATADAMQERTTKLGELEGKKKAIAEEYAAVAQQQAGESAQAAQAANTAALAELHSRQEVCAKNLEDRVAANRTAWVQTLYERTLDLDASGAQPEGAAPNEVSNNAAAQ